MNLKELPTKVKTFWLNLPSKWREEIVSGAHTFVTASATEAVMQYTIYGNALPTDKGVLLAIASVVFRSGLKALVAFIVTQWKTNKES